MPVTSVVFYQDDDGTVPVLEWLDSLPRKAQDKCFVKISRLAELGHELRRPEAAVLAHGIIKEREVPPQDIDRAIERKRKFERDPEKYTYSED